MSYALVTGWLVVCIAGDRLLRQLGVRSDAFKVALFLGVGAVIASAYL